MTPTTAAHGDADGKAVLFCPRCGYRGQRTDWVPVEDTRRLRCPSCGRTIG